MWLERGLVLRERRQYEEAIDAFDRTLEIDPSSRDAWNYKGDVLEKLKRYDEAQAAFEAGERAQRS